MIEVGEFRSKPQCNNCVLRLSVCEATSADALRLTIVSAALSRMVEYLPIEIKRGLEALKKADGACEHFGRIVLALYAQFDMNERPDMLLELNSLVESLLELGWVKPESIRQGM